MLRISLMFLAALPLCGVGAVIADPPAEQPAISTFEVPVPGPVAGVYQTTGAIEAGEYWLGVQCLPVMPALRAQLSLPERQGLLIGVIAPKSPAANAGVAQHDILMRAGDKPLREPRDLIAAIEAAKTGKLKLEVIRGGKPKTIEVTPMKRPDMAARFETGGMVVQVPSDADWRAVQQWMEGMVPGEPGEGPRPNVMFRVVHPGAIVPKDVLIARPLPGNVSISVSSKGKEATNITIKSEGNKPATITVHRGKQQWEVTEKELDKLPADIRSIVVSMLGHGPIGFVGTFKAPNVQALPPSVATATVAAGSGPFFYQQFPGPGMIDQRLEKRLDEINSRIDKLFHLLERKMEERSHAPATPPAPMPKPDKK